MLTPVIFLMASLAIFDTPGTIGGGGIILIWVSFIFLSSNKKGEWASAPGTPLLLCRSHSGALARWNPRDGKPGIFCFFGASSLPRAPELEFVSTCRFGRFYDAPSCPPKPTHAQKVGPECVYLLYRSAQQAQIHNFSDPGGQNIFFLFFNCWICPVTKKRPTECVLWIIFCLQSRKGQP